MAKDFDEGLSGLAVVTIGSPQHQAHIERFKEDIDGFKYNFSNLDWVTRCIALGPYPLNKEEILAQAGITHVLYVGDGLYHTSFRKELFKETIEVPVEDLCEIPVPTAKRAISELHRMLHSDTNSKVYVHCSAGQNRSPNILWLYLTSVGLPPEYGIKLICSARLDAVPGNEIMVPKGSSLIEEVQRFGKEHLQTVYGHILSIK